MVTLENQANSRGACRVGLGSKATHGYSTKGTTPLRGRNGVSKGPKAGAKIKRQSQPKQERTEGREAATLAGSSGRIVGSGENWGASKKWKAPSLRL